jgi:hypothetical protein
MWVRWYSATAVVVMFAVGALTRDARWAILGFVLVLFGLSAYKIVSNIRRGGYGGEE